MQRVLDLDLDFFVYGAEHFRDFEAGRLDDAEFPSWSVDDALGFLRERCGLTDRLPGVVVENHSEIFFHWRDAVTGGRLAAPFSVTHVDAHADLGLGDAGWVPLLTEVMHRPPEKRVDPGDALGDGNFLAFAVACRWVADITYVYGEGGGSDVMPYLMEDYDPRASHICIPALTLADKEALMSWNKPKVERREPRVPFQMTRWETWRTEGEFDAVSLCRSPAFTPPAADSVFDAIRGQFIDEVAWSSTP